MNVRRCGATCTVFEGKIVVTCGYNGTSYNSVEANDHHENKWTYLPGMIQRRLHHSSVSLGNKLRLILGHYKNKLEVLNSDTRTFSIINYKMKFPNIE